MSGKNELTVSCKSSAQSASNVCALCDSYARTEAQCVDGAGLFYITPLPDTLQVLRQYALHLLFIPPAPSLTMAGSEAPAPVRNPFPFQHKPNPLDRDRIVVPVGWDSWGKISVLRDGFDAKAWGDAWERDLEHDDAETEPGARKLYAALVPDQGVKVRALESQRAFLLTAITTQPPPLPPFNNPTPEQAFLAKNYDENSKKPDRDPRGAFRNPNESVSAGIVGPMGSSSFNLPTVERALTEMEGVVGSGSSSLGMSTGPEGARKSRATSGRPPSTLAVPLSATNSRSNASSPILPAGSPSPTGGQTQHEVLQNFFQSLLSNKDRASTGAATGRTGSPNSKANANGNASGADEGT